MQNPFSDFKTNEMPIEKIQELFTPPCHIERIYTPNATFITGQRGSGKTMFMRYVENNPRISDGKVEYIGVYYRFDRLIYGSQVFNSMEYELFLHHLIIALLKQLVNCISSLCTRNNKPLTEFKAFARVVCSVFFDMTTECNSFEELWQYLEKQRLNTMFYVRNARRTECPIICDYSSCFQNIVAQLHTEPWLSDMTILFLLDEYENLNSKQRQAVNGLIKATSYGYTFKVFHRPAKLETQVLDSEEHLMVQHDIMVTDFYEEIIGGDEKYPDWMTRVVEKRLQRYYESNGVVYKEKDLLIENYLTTISVQDEFSEFQKRKKVLNSIIASIKKSYGDDYEEVVSYAKTLSDDVFLLRLFRSILDKRLARIDQKFERIEEIKEVIVNFSSKTSTYRGWIENYRYAVLYLLCFENRVRKQTAGWDQLLNISKGIARHVINILYYTFENGLTSDGKVFQRFSAEEQTEAVYAVAERLYDDIIRVPVVGRREQFMIQYFGRVFQICHQDSAIKKWEVNHFVISKQNEQSKETKLADEVDRVLDAAVTWGHLIKGKATKAKVRQEFQADLSEYQLHPLLSVYFGISWRRKQRFETTYEEVHAAAFNEQLRRTNIYKVAKRVLGTNSKKVVDELETQQSLFDGSWSVAVVDVE